MTERMRINIAWLLTGAVMVAVLTNVYINSREQHLKHHLESYTHYLNHNNNNNKESETLCPCISIPSP